MRWRTILFILLALALASGGAAAEELVARVNGQPITREEFGRALVQSLGRSALPSMVDRVLVEQEARRRGITLSKEELKDRRALERRLLMRGVLTDARMGPEEFRLTAEKYGWDLDELQRELDRSVSETRLRLKLLCEKLLEERIDLSEAALRAYFQRTRGRRYAAAHILVADRDLAEDIAGALREDPDSWEAAVLRYSLDRNSAPHQGRIGPVAADTSLGAELAGMEPGELKVCPLGDLWQVLRLLRRIPASEDRFEEVREDIRAELLAVEALRRHNALLAELHRDAELVTNLSSRPAVSRVLGRDVAAYVGGEPLPISELADALIEEFGPPMIEMFVERELIFQQAERAGLTIAEEALQQRLLQIADQLFEERAARRDMTPRELEQFLSESGISTQAFKENLIRELVSREDVRATLLAEKLVADRVEVDEEDVRAAYADVYGESVRVREMTAETAAEARSLYERLMEGVDFDLLLQTEVGRPGAWMRGEAGAVVTSSHPYYSYVSNLGAGEVAGPFKHEDKYRILKVVEHRQPAERPPLESVRERLEREVFLRKARTRIRALLVKLKAESEIEILLDTA
ncbi:MAG: hypothetical protein R6V05_12160 [Candidatus Brocadiia bacterium]